VKSGYGRNFLLPKGKATLATPDNVKKFEARRAELEKVAREQFADAESRAVAFKEFKLQNLDHLAAAQDQVGSMLSVDREIEKAVRGRRGIARTYVKWVRRRSPQAVPAEIIATLERHYVTAIKAAGAAIMVGGIAAEVGIAMIPVVGPATTGGKAIAKEVAKSAVEAGVKVGSEQAVTILPAGDEQLQFEITAVFALALAEIHGLELDHDQARALVYGLSNEQISEAQVANLLNDLAQPLKREGRGRTRFVFGRAVVDTSRTAFAQAPGSFPAQLAIDVKAKPENHEGDSNRALRALEDAAKTVSTSVTGRAVAIGAGAATAAVVVGRQFRSVDLDGDGIPDEARALTAAKGVGGAVAGTAGLVGGFVSSRFKSKVSKPKATGEEDPPSPRS